MVASRPSCAHGTDVSDWEPAPVWCGWTPTGGTCPFLRSTPALPGLDIQLLVEDAGGVVWIGTSRHSRDPRRTFRAPSTQCAAVLILGRRWRQPKDFFGGYFPLVRAAPLTQAVRPVNDDGTRAAKRFVGLFFATLFLYITFYGACTAYRRKGGPWAVTQDKLPDGTPVLRIEHHRILADGPVTLTFPGETAPARFTNAPYQRVFTLPNTNTFPYGPVEFLDTTFLPGSVALDVFGHLVELVPRTLYLDGRDVGWTPGTNLVVPKTSKVPREARPQRKER